MKPSTQTRVDNFAQSGTSIHVIGRKNHIISSEQIAKQTFNCELYTDFEQDPKFDNAYTSFLKGRVRAHVDPSFYTAADATNQPVDNEILIHDYPINRTLSELVFQPETSTNTLKTHPIDQLALLPYLAEEQIQKNMEYRIPTSVKINEDANWVDADTGQPAPGQDYPLDTGLSYRYHPTEQGMFFLRLHEYNDQYESEEEAINYSEQQYKTKRSIQFNRKFSVEKFP